ncbi:hypothetical protein Fcan01_27206 [Folsomia candida]|uniref:Uncharacterized protein n=1 Tax=Folsomia candida TaxID=158441 RepID=A0A226CZV6_FOLCA|nr:hypothetical protein Fcan01_27206 [Folsomia candida]
MNIETTFSRRSPAKAFSSMFSQLLLTCSVFVSLSFCGDPEGTPSGGSDLFVSQYYKEHQIRTEQLCPDLQESPAGRDIDTANYPYKSVFKLADQVWRTADPCVFDTPSRGPRNQFTTLVIKAIQGENQPWNYSGAQPCPEHIKLRIPSRRIFSRTGMPLCTVPKPPNPAKLFQGPYYNPHVWQLTRQKMGLSFALYENETIGQMKDDEDGGNEANNEIGAQPNNGFVVTNAAKLPKFVHIVFALLIVNRHNPAIILPPHHTLPPQFPVTPPLTKLF